AQESMKEKIDEVRRNLHDTIPGQIRPNMTAAFEKAAEERGRGMKARMLETIGKHAKDSAKVMFSDARKAVIDGIGGLLDALRRRGQEMGKGVTRQSGLMVENVTNVSPGLTRDQVARIERELAEAESALKKRDESAVTALAWRT